MSTEQKLQTISTNNTIIAENEQKVYDAGVELGEGIGNSEFWGNFQNYGERTNYYYGFIRWEIDWFQPQYDIKPVNAESMFQSFQSEAIDFQDYLDKLGISLSFSDCTRMNNCFNDVKFTRLGTIDMTKIVTTNGNGAFASATNLKTIDKIIFSETTKVTASTFNNCRALENIVIEGVIATNDFNVSYSTLLTHDSLMSIINALKDYSEDASGTTYKLTLGTTNLDKLTAEEKAIATQKGWTLA